MLLGAPVNLLVPCYKCPFVSGGPFRSAFLGNILIRRRRLLSYCSRMRPPSSTLISRIRRTAYKRFAIAALFPCNVFLSPFLVASHPASRRDRGVTVMFRLFLRYRGTHFSLSLWLFLSAPDHLLWFLASPVPTPLSLGTAYRGSAAPSSGPL